MNGSCPTWPSTEQDEDIAKGVSVRAYSRHGTLTGVDAAGRRIPSPIDFLQLILMP